MPFLCSPSSQRLSRRVGGHPPALLNRLPPDTAANVCAAWSTAFRSAGCTEAADLICGLAHAFLMKRRTPTPATYDAWLRAFPEDPLFLNNAAWTHLIAEDNAEAALALIRRIPSTQRTPAHADTLAYAFLRMGLSSDALQAALQGIESVRRGSWVHPLAFEHLGDALRANGFQREALTAWRAARRAARQGPASDAPVSALLPSGYDDARLLLKIKAFRRVTQPFAMSHP